MFIVKSISEDTFLMKYIGFTKSSVEEKIVKEVKEAKEAKEARKEKFKGTLERRLKELKWKIVEVEIIEVKNRIIPKHEEMNYLRIALGIQGIGFGGDDVLQKIIETYDILKEKKGKTNLEDIVKIESEVEKRILETKKKRKFEWEKKE